LLRDDVVRQTFEELNVCTAVFIERISLQREPINCCSKRSDVLRRRFYVFLFISGMSGVMHVWSFFFSLLVLSFDVNQRFRNEP